MCVYGVCMCMWVGVVHVCSVCACVCGVCMCMWVGVVHVCSVCACVYGVCSVHVCACV